MRRAIRRRRISGRYRTADALALAKWLGGHGIRYCKTDVFGQAWRDKKNRGAPPFLIVDHPPVCPKLPGVAVYMWPGGYAHITKSQSKWIDHFDSDGWCVLIAHGIDEAVEQLERLGYGAKHEEQPNGPTTESPTESDDSQDSRGP